MDPIIKAATELVEEHGEDFTIDQLVKAAGVSRSTIYRRHGGRDGVVAKLVEQGVDVSTQAGARERVLGAVGQLVGVEGRLDATVDEIAAAAGVSAMSVFRIFGDKTSLLREFVDEVTPRRITLPTLADGDAPMADVLGRVARATLQFARAHPGLIRIGFTSWRDHEALFSLNAQQGSTRQALVTYMEARIAAGQIDAANAGAPAAYFAAMLIAEAMIAPAMGDALDTDAAADRVVERFLRAFS